MSLHFSRRAEHELRPFFAAGVRKALKTPASSEGAGGVCVKKLHEMYETWNPEQPFSKIRSSGSKNDSVFMRETPC